MSASTSEIITLNTQSERVQQFLIELRELCINHGLSISHEDIQCGFVIEEYDEATTNDLMMAFDLTQWKAEVKS